MTTIRTCLSLLGFASVLVLAGCPTTGDDTPPADDAGTSPDADNGPPCGRNTTLCKDGGKCEGALDCESKSCRDGACKSVTPANGTKDGDETDVDCGGQSAPACADGKACLVKDDCVSEICKGGLCQAPSPTDGIKNGDETDVDCGGAKAPKCAVGKGCKLDTDCNAVKCDPVQKVCQPPSYTDGIKNGDETDVDCGGGSPTKCAVGKDCKVTADCDNVKCDAAKTKKCLPPAKDDGIKNGTETDVDCGGGAPTNADACAVGKGCAIHADCASNGCAYNNKCALARSCTPHEGGDTCGKGEVGTAGADHESCCAIAPLPANPNVWLGKYEITAGRMREFIKRTSGNVRAFVDANPVSQIRDQDKDYLPEGDNVPVRTFSHCDGRGQNCTTENVSFGVFEHLGNSVFLPDRPCPNCGQGCYIGTIAAGGYGHPTYWMPNNVQALFGAQPREFSQQELDVKSLNCVTQLLLAAFCAWDGGRLPTLAELGTGADSAWGPGNFPWGNTPSANGTLTNLEPGTMQYPENPGYYFFPMVNANDASINPNAVLYNTTNFNPFRPNGFQQYLPNLRYIWPQRPFATWDHTDGAASIAAPGRMVNDRRNLGAGVHDGFFDLAANIMETTGDAVGTDDAAHNSMPQARWVGGSFEGHGVQRGGYLANGSILTKYGKMGGRCAYDK